MGIEPNDLALALAEHTRTLAYDNWAVGANATTTVIPSAIRNPSSATINLSTAVCNDLQGAVVEFRSGANSGSSRTITGITSAGVLTLDEALGTAPSEGDLFVILKSAIVNINSVTASENIAQVGGTDQTAADWTPFFKGVYEATAAAGTAAPANVLQVGGYDPYSVPTGQIESVRVFVPGAPWGGHQSLSTLAQLAVYSDTNGNFGRVNGDGSYNVGVFGGNTEASIGAAAPANQLQVSSFPVEIASIANGTAAVADTGVLGADYTAPANGIVNVTAAIAAGDTAAQFQVTLDGANYYSFNSATSLTDLTPGAVYTFSVTCHKGDTINFAFNAATTIGILRASFVASQ